MTSESTTQISTQQTLDGGLADGERRRPDTLLQCPECGEILLRSRRFDHEHDVTARHTVTQAQKEQLQEKIPDDAILDTQTYAVTFHYEMTETVTVEASSKPDAYREAEHHQTLKGEYEQTIHKTADAWGEESQASVEYLRNNGLLPEDHDVTQEDLEELAHAQHE